MTKIEKEIKENGYYLRELKKCNGFSICKVYEANGDIYYDVYDQNDDCQNSFRTLKEAQEWAKIFK
jgi:hypothetical protein